MHGWIEDDQKVWFRNQDPWELFFLLEILYNRTLPLLKDPMTTITTAYGPLLMDLFLPNITLRPLTSNQ